MSYSARTTLVLMFCTFAMLKQAPKALRLKTSRAALSSSQHTWIPLRVSGMMSERRRDTAVSGTTSRLITTRLFATTQEDELATVTAAIATKGDDIRKLKADKAAKELITPVVNELLQLKKDYERLTGKPFDPPKEEKTTSKAPTPAPAPKPAAKEIPVASTEISEPIERVNYYSAVTGEGIGYGDYDIIASQSETGREFVSIDTLGTETGPKVGDKVWIRGRVASVRAKGNACFMVLRAKSFYTIQTCHFKDAENAEESKKLIKYVGNLSLESIVDVMGEVVAAEVKSCSQSNVEISIKKVYTVSRAPTALPFLLEDAARPQAEIDASQVVDILILSVYVFIHTLFTHTLSIHPFNTLSTQHITHTTISSQHTLAYPYIPAQHTLTPPPSQYPLTPPSNPFLHIPPSPYPPSHILPIHPHTPSPTTRALTVLSQRYYKTCDSTTGGSI